MWCVSLPEIWQAHLHFRLEAIMEEETMNSMTKDEVIVELMELLKRIEWISRQEMYLK